MKKQKLKSAKLALLCATLFAPGIGTAGIDSFFDITYEISPTARDGIPTVTARLSTGEPVKLVRKGSAKYFNESKGFDIRMTFEQNLNGGELVDISARCSDTDCVITGVGERRHTHRGHVTVLK